MIIEVTIDTRAVKLNWKITTFVLATWKVAYQSGNQGLKRKWWECYVSYVSGKLESMRKI